jgi:hypothetical protein
VRFGILLAVLWQVAFFGMESSYEQAVSALYRAPHESFVSERRRLARELKAEGDKSGAAQLAKLGRPPISAWAVNQLWWHAREAFDELFDTAAQLRSGKLTASPAHRKAIARLGVRAQQLLSEGGHSASDATLRRVTMTLSGLAAAGSFEPDTPGALTNDRDPPGFEAFGIASSSDEPVGNEPAVSEKPAPRSPAQPFGHREAPHAALNDGKALDIHAAERKREAEAAAAERKREAEAAAAERKRQAEAAAAERKREAEAQARRQKLESELGDAKAELAEREHERDRVAKQLATAEREVERARASVDAAQAELETDRAS